MLPKETLRRKQRVKEQKRVGKKIMNLISEYVELRKIFNLIILNRHIGMELREFWLGNPGLTHQPRLSSQNWS